MTYIQRLSFANLMIGLHLLSLTNGTASIHGAVGIGLGAVGIGLLLIGWLGLILPSKQDKD